MKVGLAGFPRSGRTTVFAALTGQDVSARAGDPSGVRLGTIKVPDPRVDELARRFRPRKVTYAEIIFVDFPAPPLHGESKGRALDPATITHMRDADALVHIVRGFADPITGEAPQPIADLEALKSELILHDLAIVERRLERLKKEKGHEAERALLSRCHEALEQEIPLRRIELSVEEANRLAGFGFLSRRPMMVVWNVDEALARSPLPVEIQEWLRREELEGLLLAGKIEMEIAQLPEADRAAFLADLGLSASARERFIRAAYALLDLISFLTAGEDEVRAWTIRRGTTAVKAAGKIHSDIERGFIRAEVLPFEDFVAFGSEGKAREAGRLRLEGKNYVVRDGDIIHFRFHV
jgi:GTP-binding protein YchF